MSLNKIHRDSNKVKYNLILIRFTKIKKISNQCGRQEKPQEKSDQKRITIFVYQINRRKRHSEWNTVDLRLFFL